MKFTLKTYQADAVDDVLRSLGAKVVFSVWIGWRDQAQLQQLLADQQNPASPDYQRWLSPAQVRSRFAPARDEVKQVSDWLRSGGFDLVTVRTTSGRAHRANRRSSRGPDSDVLPMAASKGFHALPDAPAAGHYQLN